MQSPSLGAQPTTPDSLRLMLAIGATWRVKGISPSCWVPANATVPFNRDQPEPAFAAVADHVLARGDSASFETLVEAENSLMEPNPYAGLGIGQSSLASGLLQFRRLLLIERASRLVGGLLWSSRLVPFESATVGIGWREGGKPFFACSR